MITVNAASTVPVIASSSCRPLCRSRRSRLTAIGSARKPKPVTRLQQEEHDRRHELDGVGHVGLDAGRRAVGEAAEQQESRPRRRAPQRNAARPTGAGPGRPAAARRPRPERAAPRSHGRSCHASSSPARRNCVGAVRTIADQVLGLVDDRVPVGQVVTYGDLAGMVGSGWGHDRSRDGALRRGGSLVAGGPGQWRAGTRARAGGAASTAR